MESGASEAFIGKQLARMSVFATLRLVISKYGTRPEATSCSA